MSVPAGTPLRDLQPRLDDGSLSVAQFPADWRPPADLDHFASLVVDHDEVTLVAADAVVTRFEGADAVEAGWRRITFAGPLPWEMVGFLADVAARLAAARIPFTSMSGFTTDHVLVRAAQAELALAVLRGEPTPDQRPDVTNP